MLLYQSVSLNFSNLFNVFRKNDVRLFHTKNFDLRKYLSILNGGQSEKLCMFMSIHQCLKPNSLWYIVKENPNQRLPINVQYPQRYFLQDKRWNKIHARYDRIDIR